MSYIKKLTVSRISPDIDEVRLVSWIVKEGATFKAGDVLLEVETDKSVIEIQAEEDAELVKYLAAEGDVVDFDTPVADIQLEGEAPTELSDEPEPIKETDGQADEAQDAQPDIVEETKPAPILPTTVTKESENSDRILSSPAARKAAADRGLSLTQIQGTGPNSRITLSDVKSASIGAGAPNYSSNDLHVINWQARPADARQNTPTVVLLHGIFGDSDTWASVMSGMRKAGLSGLAVDLPCHGLSESNADTFDAIVDVITAYIQANVSGQIALIGHSFGAGIAACVASRISVRLHSLGLIAPVGLGTEINQSFLDGVRYSLTHAALSRELSKLTDVPVKMSDAYLDILLNRLQQKQQPLANLCESFAVQGVQQCDIRDSLAALKDTPIVVLQGRKDAVIPWQHMLNIGPNAAMHLFPDAGHMPHWEYPTIALDILTDMICR